MDPGANLIATQDSRHTVQRDTEPVMGFILQLERILQRAYGKDNMSVETKDILLYGQLHASLWYSLIKAPTVSGANILYITTLWQWKSLTNLMNGERFIKIIPANLFLIILFLCRLKSIHKKFYSSKFLTCSIR